MREPQNKYFIMKRILIIIMALLSIVVMNSSASSGILKRNRMLTDLWIEYNRASEKDMVRDMADLLGKIKDIALENRFSEDYFRACEEYVNIMSRRNWKLTEQLIASAAEELHSYGEPSLEILFGLRHGQPVDSLVAKVARDADAMKKVSNKDIYRQYGHEIFNLVDADRFNRMMCMSIANDYEFIMWSLAAGRGYSEGDVYDGFVEYLGGGYPAVPYLQWLKLRSVYDEKELREGLEKMAEEFAGRGVGIAAEDELMEMRFNEMDGKASSEEYRSLEKDLLNLVARKKALKGDEAVVAEIHATAARILERLRGKEAVVEIEDGKAGIIVRNLSGVRFEILEDEEIVFKSDVFNETMSFYRRDTLNVEIPVLDDGEYTAVVYDGSDKLDIRGYEKYTVSLGKRFAADGMCIYAADYMTGEPVGKADLLLYDMKMQEKVVEVKGFIFNGFTELPEDIYPLPDDKGYRLVCRYEKDGLVHCSKPLHIKSVNTEPGASESVFKAVVVRDRAAFVPGDTVRFKAFLYEEFPDGTKAAVTEGEDVIVQIGDPEGNTVSKMRLTTNEFGSASGSYAVREDGRNGQWTIRVRKEGYEAETSYFTVDDFVLPSYDLSFNDADRLYLPGDTVKVTGRVMSWSGHGLSGLDVTADIYVNHDFVRRQAVELGADGSFGVSFVAGDAGDEYASYRVEVRLVDGTGETLEFNWNSDAVREINLNASIRNRDSGSFRPTADDGNRMLAYGGNDLFSADTAEIRCWVSVRGVEMPDIPLGYELMAEGRILKDGTVQSGDILNLDMSGLPSGLYNFVLKASVTDADGHEVTSSKTTDILYLREDADAVPCGTAAVFRTSYDDGVISMQLGSGAGPVWAVVELFGKDSVPLEKRMLHIDGKAGEPGSLATLVFPHLDEYSDKVLLNVFYFKDGRKVNYQDTFVRTKTGRVIPLEFTSFEDRALPGQDVSLRMKTDPDVEVLVSVFDASSQKISFNSWERLRFGETDYGVSVRCSSVLGCDETDFFVIAYGSGRGKALRTGNSVMTREAMAYDSVDEEEVIRDDFATTLAFEPFLRPSSDGTVDLEFRTSGKLSTFIVKAVAHDRSMNTAFAEREMTVTMPVRVSVIEPRYLYAGDKYVLNASVSNTSASSLTGVACLEVYDQEAYPDVEPVSIDSLEVDVPAGGSVMAGFSVDVPEDVDILGFKVVFVGHECASEGMAANEAVISDGMFVPVPVYPSAQVLTESRSAVLVDGRPADEVVAELREKFVNVSSAGAEYEEISLMDIMKKAFPGAAIVEEKDAVSLSDGLYANVLAYGLVNGGYGICGEDNADAKACVEAAVDAMSRLLECADDDGGFGWLEGMPSSPAVTAVVLGRYADLRDGEALGFISELMGEDALDDMDEAMTDAVRYLDASCFGDEERPLWYGGLSLEQYLDVRARFAGVPFDREAAVKNMGRKRYKEFRKAVRAYLVPKGSGRDYSGGILSKVRKVRIIDCLGTEAGSELAKAWGVASGKRLEASRTVEAVSLRQYAVKHPSGGVYYPNAVMPWKGLLESEAYAHALIADMALKEAVLGKDPEWAAIADGVRIWIMLQKETQEWSGDPGFVEAMASVMDGAGRIMDTKVTVLSKRYMKPFGEIIASGNGFEVSVDYYVRGADGSLVKLAEGDELHVGDKITAVCSLWSGENRSHVRLSVPRAACFRPADQLSGPRGGRFCTLAYGSRNVSPYIYREVKSDRTLWWIDVFPEENTRIEEELFVTMEGVFTAPVAEIESCYAPHYRANDGYAGFVKVSGKDM